MDCAGAKRRAAVAGGREGKDAKRSKKNSTKLELDDDSRKLFQRLVGEDDDIVILEGLSDYSAKKKADTVNDLHDFLEFIKKNIHIDVGQTQLQDKIRRLKKKYDNNARREKKGKKELSFETPREKKTYELSKKVWGEEKNGGWEENAGSTPRVVEVEEKLKEVKDLVTEKNVVEELKNVNFDPTDGLTIEEWVLKNGAHLIRIAKERAELGKKWRELKVKELELLARRTELMAMQTKLILEGLK